MTGLVGGIVVALGLWFASPALAAFPGANGLLAVQPTSGGGILLVGANGRVVRRICTSSTLCGTPRRPRWSPDGRAIVFAGPAIRIVYADGSCMNCEFGAAPSPAFKPGGGAISFIQSHYVTLDGIDGLRKPYPRLGTATDAVWSAGGKVAVVRGGAVWAGRPGKLIRLVAGSEPSWSPTGDAIAVVQADWVVIIGARGGRVRRLARGSAPAFSPDGRSIAFVAPDDRLMIIPARGGRARAVGNVRAASVDWQPKPRGPNPGCAAPPGSTVLASTSNAIVTGDGKPPPLGFGSAPPIAYMGCLRRDGRERLLERFANNYDDASWVTSAALALPYAALVERLEDLHYGGMRDVVQVLDLRTGGQRTDLGGEAADCAPTTEAACSALDQVVLSSDGVSAAHSLAIAPLGSLLSEPFDSDACAPASTICMAVDQLGTFFTSGNPSGGAGSWTSGSNASLPPISPQGMVCPGPSLCIAAGADIYTSSDPAGGASTWSATNLNAGVTLAGDIACPTTALCVVTRLNGTIATSTNPTGGTAAWNVAQIDPGHALEGVVCSSEPRCFMTDDAGTVFASPDPTGGSGAWTASSATPSFLSGACPTTSLCVTLGEGAISTTTDPDAAVWTQTSIPDGLRSVSCPSSSLCVAVGAAGALDVSTDPASDTWSRATVDYGLDLISVSCASTSLCVATDENGHVLVSTDPAGDPSTWIPTLLAGDPCTDGHDCTIESIQTSDGTGLHTADSIKTPGSGPFLTGLTLNGDTLSWSHDGSPRSVELTPPR